MELDRRNFLKSAMVAGVAATAAGLVGCSPRAKPDSDASTAHAGPAAEGANAAKTWKDAPEPITDIAETVEADVVVVGAGASGTCAALAAVEGGAKTVCIQKGPMVLTHGSAYGAWNSSFQREAGIEIDLLEMTNAHIRYNSMRPQFTFVQEIFKQSAETLEWITDRTGFGWSVKNKAAAALPYEPPSFATGHGTEADKAIGLSTALADLAVEKGAEFYFDTPGVQLVQDGSGRVTGVIGQNKKGEYVQFNAAKGVVLATGDYGSDYEMCADLCPWAVGTNNYYYPNNNTGDGHKMGTWVGARMEDAPHTKMAHVHSTSDGKDLSDSPIKSNPFLWVNSAGERFCNEDVSFWYICNAVRMQPTDEFFLVFDANYNDHIQSFRKPGKAVDESAVQAAIDKGFIKVADTLEDAAKAWDIPADALVKTVARYNELAVAGVDEDFCKDAANMKELTTPPYYICRSFSPMDVTMGGLMTNLKMQVVDEENKVIEGLYAAGNTSGGFYGGTDYDMEVDGFSLGRAATTGRLAGTYAAE